jgi:hypothetical protein
VEILYYGFKTILLASMVRALVVAEPLKRHVLTMSVVYTAIVALLSYAFLLSQHADPNYRLWQVWLGVNLAMTYAYFKLLTTFDESALFWLVLPFAVVIVLNEPNLVPIWKMVFGGVLHSGERLVRGAR